MRPGNERRRFTRYYVAEGSLFILNHFSTRVGWIRDISNNGLAFDYICNLGYEVAPEVVDIFAHQPSGIYLPAIRCRAIFNRRLPKEDDTASRPDMNRCGICFHGISESQRDELQFLITCYGT